MKKSNNVSIFVTFFLSLLGWTGLSYIASNVVGNSVNAFITRNPKSKSRQFAGGFVIGFFLVAMHFIGKLVGGKVADVLIAAQRDIPENNTDTPADRFVNLNTEEDDEDDDVWEPSIEMEPKTVQV